MFETRLNVESITIDAFLMKLYDREGTITVRLPRAQHFQQMHLYLNDRARVESFGFENLSKMDSRLCGPMCCRGIIEIFRSACRNLPGRGHESPRGATPRIELWTYE